MSFWNFSFKSNKTPADKSPASSAAHKVELIKPRKTRNWKPSISRSDIVFFLLAAGLIWLGAELGQSIYRHENPVSKDQADIVKNVERAKQGAKITLPIPARPGNIYARSRRSHVMVAGSRQVPSCFIDPKLLDNDQLADVTKKVSKILELDPNELLCWLNSKRSNRFVWVAREISPEQAQAVRDLKCRALGIQYEWIREYPNEKLAGTIIGFRQKDGQPGGGLELTAAKIISANDGKRVVHADARRRAIWADTELTVPPTDGGNVYISIDVNIQETLQKEVAAAVAEFDAKWGVGVVMNPWTGDILAMCSAPTYDPNQYNITHPSEMVNRAIGSPYEPGSVFKPIMAAAAVEDGTVTYQTMIDCEGGVYNAVKGGRISDHGNSYGPLSLWDVVVHSSNIGMAKLGEKMGNQRLWTIAHQWGFGQKTGVELPGETAGIIRKLEKWDGYSLRRIPFGQEISTSALQLTMAFSAIANGGLLMKPRLIQSVTDSEGNVVWSSKPGAVRRVLSPSVANQSLAVLQDVVQNGTGKNCKLENWTSWGKTGTAQVPGPKGYTDGAYTGSFVGGAPVEKPAVVCLISIYCPDRNIGYYGSTVAAPAVKRVLEKTLTYLNVTPDRVDEYPRPVATGR